MADRFPRVIRASSLPMYPDCPRRWAARTFKRDIEAAGFELRELPEGIGAATGTATHAGVAYVNTAHMEADDFGNETERDQRALAALDEVTADGVLWDRTTGDRNTAERQILRQVRIYRDTIAPTFKPIAVEQRHEAKVGEAFVLSGTLDLAEGENIRDLKTGTVPRYNGSQFGAYALLRRTAGHPANGLIEDFVRRATMTKPQPEPESLPHLVEQSERMAWETINRIIEDAKKFDETGEPWAFLPNPSSTLCGDKYCPVHGTRFCRAHRGAK
jgi:hypothetical protein